MAMFSPLVSGKVAADAAEADVAHAGVHHLRVTRRRAVAPTVGRCAEERAALHHFPRDADGGLGGIEGAFHRRAAGLRRGAAAGLGRTGLRMARGPPVHRPLPDVPAYLEQAVTVGWVAPDGAGAGEAVGGEVPPGKRALPGVGAVRTARGQLLPPGELRALEAAAGGELPL